ncbi:MAG: hypothetical protein EBT79_06740 [Actinobacteria bacterium]|jgi:hypothetical protein|nr:hypothetical protein [Actinomycetota bacterium]NBR66961.1 hypothetical protein [Actinomycetota bacterium]
MFLSRKFMVPVAVLSALVVPTAVRAATTRLTVTGRVTGSSGQQLSVLLVANNGTGVRVTPKANGTFTATVPAKVASSFVTTKSGKGPTLHVLKSGKYGGPVVLGKKNSTTGYTRLSTKSGGSVSVGTIAMKTGYAVAATKTSTIDTKSTIRMKSSKPVSSGSVREASLFGPVASFAVLTADQSEVGADADRDGLPNFADADVNGDSVLDAAQPSAETSFQGVSGDKIMERRPEWDFAFRKIVRSNGAAPINSNLVPTVTGDQIGTFLSTGLQVEIAGNIDSSQVAGGSVNMWCQVAYCQSGSSSTLVSSSDPTINGKTIDTVRNPDGSLALQKTSPETRRALVFKPGNAVKGTNALTGDAYGFTTVVNGVVVANEVRILTSGVVSPAAFVSAPGRTFGAEVQSATSVRPTTAQMAAFPITFHRAQDLAAGSSTQLVDRGGLRYRFVAFTDGPNGMHVCRPSAMSGLSPTLVKPVDETSTDSMKAYLFDSEQMPSANGTKLSVTLNLDACLASGPGTDARPAAGTGFNLYIETYDADGNESGENIRVLVP